jgi:hypothetical protein
MFARFITSKTFCGFSRNAPKILSLSLSILFPLQLPTLVQSINVARLAKQTAQKVERPVPRGIQRAVFPISSRRWQKEVKMGLRAAPNGDDRTQSPAPISRKRELSRRRPETFGNCDPQFTHSGARRPTFRSQKPANCGPFWPLRR